MRESPRHRIFLLWIYAGPAKPARNSREPAKKSCRSNILFFPQPVSLRLEVPVNNIALFVLETPGYDKDGIAFPYPLPLLHLSLDPAEAGDPVDALDTDVVCPLHRLGTGKLLIIPFLWQPDTADRRTSRVHCIRVCCTCIFFSVKTTHSTNYVRTTSGG